MLVVSGCTSAGAESTLVGHSAMAARAAAEASAAQAAGDRQRASDAAVKAEKLRAEKLRAEKLRADKLRADKLRADKLRADKLRADKLRADKLRAAITAAKARAAELAAAKAAAMDRAKKLQSAKRAAAIRAAKLNAAKLAYARAKAAARARLLAAAKAAMLIDPINGRARSRNSVVAVKIDNTSGGRPQYGLSDADVIYVEQVEGGLTRLNAIFHSRLPTEVGPVRSVRTTDVDLLRAYGRPLLAFSGGAGGPLARLAASPVLDGSGGPGYWRSSAAHAPYNLHVNLPALIAGTPGTRRAQSPGFVFGAQYPVIARTPARTDISVTMSAGNTGFRYDPAARNYRVNHSGTATVDAAGHRLTADNVLVQHVTDSPDGTVDTNGQPSLLSQTVGSGAFTLYRNGHAIRGRWSRHKIDGPTSYLTGDGKPALFTPGRTWVLLAPQSAQISAS